MSEELTEDEIKYRIAEIMEPHPAPETARVLREREGVGACVEWYSTHDVYSPKNWWKAEIGTDHNYDERRTFRLERDDTLVKWKPARNPAEDIADAFEVGETLKLFSIGRWASGQWSAAGWNKTHVLVKHESAPMSICLLALECAAKDKPEQN